MKKSLGPQTMIFPLPVWCVGSYDQEGNPNAATVAWGGICNSNPPCVAVSLRKSRYSYENIHQRGAFTVNVPSADLVAAADHFGIVSGRDEDKFQATGLTPIHSELVDAPYIEEFPLVLECKLLAEYEIGTHTQFVGEILDVKVDPDRLGEDGKPDIKKINPIIYAAKTRAYYGVGGMLGEAYSIGRKD